MAPKLLYLRHHSHKIHNNRNKKNFFNATRRLANLFEPLNSSRAIGGRAMALVRQLKTVCVRQQSRYEYIVHQLPKC